MIVLPWKDGKVRWMKDDVFDICCQAGIIIRLVQNDPDQNVILDKIEPSSSPVFVFLGGVERE